MAGKRRRLKNFDVDIRRKSQKKIIVNNKELTVEEYLGNPQKYNMRKMPKEMVSKALNESWVAIQKKEIREESQQRELHGQFD